MYAGSLLAFVLLIACNGPEPVEQSEPAQVASGSLEPFSQGDLWGFRDEAGQVVIEPRFKMALDFHADGGAAVFDDQGWAYIDRRGKILLRPFPFDNGPDYFQEGLARFVAEGKMGYFNPAGEIVISAAFDFAQPFKDGRARVCEGCQTVQDGEHKRVEGGTWFTIDKTGKKTE
ncbi:MAG: WG repeat-containing protein [Acidobacteriota bacterium]|nr:WG repeat-containing protein [Acidobacteriota bacterium]